MTTETKPAIHLEDWPVAVPGSLVVWRKRLAEARERGEFTDLERDDILWAHKCAVGEYLGFPKEGIATLRYYDADARLGPLGLEAANTVLSDDFDGFAAILTELEALPRP